MLNNFVVTGVTVVHGCTHESLEEDYFIVGNHKSFGCDKIEYHTPIGEGDRHYVDVWRGENFVRLFNPTKIEFEKIENPV